MSGATLTAKILAAHGVDDLTPGALALVPVDLIVLNDVSGAVSIREFGRIGAADVFDRDRVVCFTDHFWPAKDARSAVQVSRLREFAETYDLSYWEAGSTIDGGIEHAVLVEQGRVVPGDLIVGGDSHTCTAGALAAFATGMGSSDIAAAMALGEVWIRVPKVIRAAFEGKPGPFTTGKDLILAYIAESGVDGANYAAIEFEGEAVDGLTVDGRLALCNMAVEAGAKTGMVGADASTVEWLASRVEDGRALETLAADPLAEYDRETTIDVDDLEPLVAAPFSPGNVHAVGDFTETVRVDQVYAGNCSNGTLSDLRQLAFILAGRTVARGTRLIVVPATQGIYRQAVAEGLIETFLAAGAMVSPPTCGACFGGHMGVLGDGETAVATTNRNFRGRMGAPTSQVYLANSFVAAAAAVTGELVHPSEVVGAGAMPPVGVS
jgi:3-isopropylmalate/(R)-2-methylmalate dehydratase large subunit